MVEIYQALALNWHKQVPRVGCSNASCDSRIDSLRSDIVGSHRSIKLSQIGRERLSKLCRGVFVYRGRPELKTPRAGWGQPVK